MLNVDEAGVSTCIKVPLLVRKIAEEATSVRVSIGNELTHATHGRQYCDLRYSDHLFMDQ